MALTHQPIIGRTYRVTAPEFIPCFPCFRGNGPTGTEILRGQILKFLSEAENNLWEVEYFDPNNPQHGNKRALVGPWACEWLLPIFQKNR